METKEIIVPERICDIAKLIGKDWKNVYFGAVPYLEAMYSMEKITDKYYYDSGESIVAYFLSNATSWKGETARAVKKKLNNMLKGK